MTHTYAAVRLLELGPLTVGEFRDITGWKYRTCTWVLSHLRRIGRVRLARRGCYEVAQ